jgi:hypothetical protein
MTYRRSAVLLPVDASPRRQPFDAAHPRTAIAHAPRIHLPNANHLPEGRECLRIALPQLQPSFEPWTRLRRNVPICSIAAIRRSQ